MYSWHEQPTDMWILKYMNDNKMIVWKAYPGKPWAVVPVMGYTVALVADLKEAKAIAEL